MHQNRSYPPHHLPGFNWLKLLITLAIMLVSFMLLIFVLSPSGVHRDFKQTGITLQNIRLKIEEYARDNNGTYPASEDGSSAVLYRILSGDPSGLGQPPTATVYWAELNNDNNPSLVGTLNGQRVILDGFGNPIRYRSALDKKQKPVKDINSKGNFDLWSVGPDGKPSDLNTTGTFTSEETKDDIW